MHADLKPENVLLTDPDEELTGLYPTAKVADFGTCVLSCIRSCNHGRRLGLSPWMFNILERARLEAEKRTDKPRAQVSHTPSATTASAATKPPSPWELAGTSFS